jgi:hypothetical protein
MQRASKNVTFEDGYRSNFGIAYNENSDLRLMDSFRTSMDPAGNRTCSPSHKK